jgi:hypothetical protein
MVRSAEPPVTAMGNVLSLGRARKRKQRAEEQRRADENAIRHGRTKVEKTRERMEQERLQAAVDGARREPTTGPGDADVAAARVPASDGEAEAGREPASDGEPSSDGEPANDGEPEA